jgi:hypothetical protein
MTKATHRRRLADLEARSEPHDLSVQVCWGQCDASEPCPMCNPHLASSAAVRVVRWPDAESEAAPG